MTSINVRLDTKSVRFERVSDTILTGLQSIGGFYESVMHIGVLLTFFFQERLFKSALLKQIYQLAVDPKSKGYNEKKMMETLENNQELSEDVLKDIMNFLLLRTRFRYGYREIIDYLTKCMCLRNAMRVNSTLSKSHLMYGKGNNKLERELDVVNLIRSIRALRLMS